MRTEASQRLATVIDQSVLEYETVFVSGGRRELELELAPCGLIQFCQAIPAAISR